MKADVTLCNGVSGQSNPDVVQQSSRGTQYQKVFDNSNRKITGLYKRGEVFYGRLNAVDPQTGIKKTRWIRLQVKSGDKMIDASTLAEAKKALIDVSAKRNTNTLPIVKRTPKFSEIADDYLNYHEVVEHAKKRRTIATERVHINLWKKHFGDLRIDQINLQTIQHYIMKREKEKVSPRTINLGIVVLRNVLNRAIEKKWITQLPTLSLKPLKYTPKRKRLVTLQEIESICKAALTATKNGQELADYIRFLAYSGCRRNEALRIRWADIDLTRRQLTVGLDGSSKNYESRVIDFNDKLEAHLTELHSRRAPDSEFLFPSPMRGESDKPARSLVEAMRLAKKAAGIPDFGFHHCRHFFISFCVMSGIDYLTTARWVGHKDGGILIGKTYGHLNSQHTQMAAKKLRFEPVVLDTAKEVAL